MNTKVETDRTSRMFTVQDKDKAEGKREKSHPNRRRDVPFCLPVEIVFHIFSFLPVRDLLRSAVVSKCWKRMADDPYLWQMQFNALPFARTCEEKDMYRERKLALAYGWKSR